MSKEAEKGILLECGRSGEGYCSGLDLNYTPKVHILKGLVTSLLKRSNPVGKSEVTDALVGMETLTPFSPSPAPQYPRGEHTPSSRAPRMEPKATWATEILSENKPFFHGYSVTVTES